MRRANSRTPAECALMRGGGGDSGRQPPAAKLASCNDRLLLPGVFN